MLQAICQVYFNHTRVMSTFNVHLESSSRCNAVLIVQFITGLKLKGFTMKAEFLRPTLFITGFYNELYELNTIVPNVNIVVQRSQLLAANGAS